MNIKISKDINLPSESVTEKMAWLGTTGSGKTYGASKFAEQCWHIGAQFVALDPVGVWYGLRLAKDGKKPSHITIPIFGGLHGDVPLESTAGALLANLVVDKDLSCIIDVSQFESDAEKARFATDFADRLFFRKKAMPSAMHLFLEEVQEFVPQNPQRGEERMLHAFVRMQKLGRNFGIGSSYITQRPQEVNKKALNMAQTLFVFRTTGTHERTAIEKWIEDNSLDESIANDLPKLATGTCHVWSPEFLKVSETTHILEKETFNASATPEVGVAAKKRELAPIDLEKVRTEMAATIEKAKGEDPKILRKEVARLTAELTKKQPPAVQNVTRTKIEKIEVPMIGKRALTQFEAAEKSIRKSVSKISELHEAAQAVLKAVDLLSADVKKVQHPIIKVEPVAVKSIDIKPGAVIQIPELDTNLSGPEKKILDAIAWMHSIGVVEPEQTAVAFLAGYTFGAGSFSNPKGSLRTKGLVEYVSGNKIKLTYEGSASAKPPNVPLTTEELHNKVLAILPNPEQRILKPLLSAYPEAVSSEELAVAAAYAFGSGAFNNPKGRLRSLGLIEYLPGNMVRAKDLLFL